MPLTPQDVVRKEFREAFRGYNQADVDLFLDEVVAELAALVEDNQRLKVRVTALQQELARYRPAERAPAETSEARWRLRRFLEEQGRPLDEIEPVRSATVEQIERDAPKAQDDPGTDEPGNDAPATGWRAPGWREPQAPPRNPPSGHSGTGQRPAADERREPPAPKPDAGAPPWERDQEPFWAAE